MKTRSNRDFIEEQAAYIRNLHNATDKHLIKQKQTLETRKKNLLKKRQSLNTANGDTTA